MWQNLTISWIWPSSAAVLLFFIAALSVLSTWKTKAQDKRYSIASLAFSICMFISLSINFYQFLVDDVYISLRYARNLANGHGLVFNTDGSEPIEGYTNFLWVVFESSLFEAGLSDYLILHTIKITGIIFGVGTLIMTFLLIRLLTADSRISAIGTFFLAAVPEMAFWAAGGLETSMYIFWLLAGIYRYIAEKRKKKPHILSMILIVLMALTRPEGLFFWIGILLFDLFLALRAKRNHPARSSSDLKSILTGFLVFTILYGTYFLWRYNFYGFPFPNTFYAKKLSNTEDIFHRIKQVSEFLAQMSPFISIGCLGFIYLNKKSYSDKLILLTMMLILIIFCFAARNEWMPGSRYQLPFVPILMLFFSAGIGKILFTHVRSTMPDRKAMMVSFSLLFFLGMFLVYPFNNLRREGNDLAEQLKRAHIPLGKWLKEHAPEDASYASWDMGAIPYYSEFSKIIDINSEGLLNTYTTFNGYDVDYLISLNPSFLVLPPNTSYVRPADILNFYSHEKLDTDYEFLFSVFFTKEYLLKVYKSRDVFLSDAAISEGKLLEHKSARAVQ